MAVFRYRMQSILDIDCKLEEQAKLDFAKARKALDDELDHLRELEIRKVHYQEDYDERLRGEIKVLDIISAKEAMLRVDDYIKEQQVLVSKARRKLDQARDALATAMTERKTQEKLREHAFDDFMAEERRTEGKEVDELVSYTYSTRGET